MPEWCASRPLTSSGHPTFRRWSPSRGWNPVCWISRRSGATSQPAIPTATTRPGIGPLPRRQYGWGRGQRESNRHTTSGERCRRIAETWEEAILAVGRHILVIIGRSIAGSDDRAGAIAPVDAQRHRLGLLRCRAPSRPDGRRPRSSGRALLWAGARAVRVRTARRRCQWRWPLPQRRRRPPR